MLDDRWRAVERKLLESNESDPKTGNGARWHYSIDHDGQRFAQFVFHHPDQSVYRTRIVHFRAGAGPGYEEDEVWTLQDGKFPTAEAALQLGEAVIRRAVARND